MSGPLEVLNGEERKRLEDADARFGSPMLATLTHDPFSDPRWIYERKLDGERCVAVSKGGEAHLFTRNRKQVDTNYPEVREALEGHAETGEFVVDGEIVAFEGGISSFSALQPRMHAARSRDARRVGPSVYYYLFDVMQADGKGLEHLPLRARKRVLKKLFAFQDPLRFTAHRNETGLEFYSEACEKGWEGVIAKRADSKYLHTRSKEWLKFKCIHEQEFVIGGFTDPQGGRIGFGALMIGYYEDEVLRYAGKVGTGYDEKTLRDVKEKLSRLERDTPPFVDGEDLPGRGAHWVAPELVCEVGFTEWTHDGRLRHPRFLGLRRDKRPEEVRREG